jgi:hypothetical protein
VRKKRTREGIKGRERRRKTGSEGWEENTGRKIEIR